jgi:endoglucanase
MAKKGFLLILTVTLLLAACAGNSSKGEPVSFLDHVPQAPYAESDHAIEPLSGKTVFNYFKDEKIAAGWNLGNTLDSFRDGAGDEVAWGNPRVNQEIMNGVKAAGFDIIRIPITWMGNFGDAPDHKVSLSRLRRVAEVVDMAHNAGLKVIVNLHHDGSTDSNKDNGWLSISRAARSTEQFNRITTIYARLWQQISLYFKNYGDWLIFESFNELHDGGWGGSGDINHFIVITKWNQLFVDIVRASGANNAERFLMVGAYCQDPHKTLSSGFILPTDTAEGKLIVSFHYYDPYQFGIEGSRSTWGTDADKQKTDRDFAPFKERFIDKNIPVIIGECGAVLQLYPNNQTREAEAAQSRRQYLQHIFATSKKYGLIPVYWDNGAVSGNGEKFGLFNRRTGQPNSTESETLIKLMINAVK